MAFAQKLGKGVCQIEHMIQPRRASTRISVAHRVRLNVSAFTDAQTQTSSTLAVKLSVPFKADFGQNLKVVGNISTLGGWEVDQAPEMTWSEGDVWMATLDLPEDASVEFKLVLCRPNAAPEWEASPNRTLTLPAHATAPMDISLAWGYPEAAVIVAPEATLAAAESVTLPFESAASVLVDSVAQPEPEMVITYEEPVVEAADLLVEAEGVGGISEETAEEEPVAEPKTNFLQGAARTAGYVALGVAGAAMLSALAIDVADTAVLGAVAAAASGAVLAGSSTSKAKSGAADSSEGDEGEAEGETRITGAGKPGLVIAAGLLSAFDAGKSMVDVLNGTDTDKPDEGNPEGDAAADE